MPNARPTPCRGKYDLFFSEDEEDEKRAIAHCGACWDRVGCLNRAREWRIEYGTWGGETASQRRIYLQVQVKPEPKPMVATTKMNETLRKEILKLYGQGVKPRVIRERLGLTKDQVTGVIMRSKIPRRYTQMSEADKELIARLYRENNSIAEIARQAGRSPTAIRDHLTRAGLRLPHTRERKQALGEQFAKELRSGVTAGTLASRERIHEDTVIIWAKQYGGWRSGKEKTKVPVEVVDDGLHTGQGSDAT